MDDRSTDSAAPHPGPLVAVCVITFQRPTGLRRLILSLAALDLDTVSARLELNIVDNDAARSAEPVCTELAAVVPFPINYAVEPRRGIPIARNRSVALMAPQADFAAFVDDDETMPPDWLTRLLRVQRIYGADVVAGPVLPKFFTPPPAWAVAGRFFELTRHRTGARLDRAYTNNTLVRAAVLHRMDHLFDERLVYTGGSDTELFRRVHQHGYSIIWADDALVYDWVPATRVTVRWVLQRAFRFGVMTPRHEQCINPGLRSTARIAAIGCYRVLKGALLLVPSGFFARHCVVTSLRHICYGAGMLAGCLGLRYDEYRRTHGI